MLVTKLYNLECTEVPTARRSVREAMHMPNVSQKHVESLFGNV